MMFCAKEIVIMLNLINEGLDTFQVKIDCFINKPEQLSLKFKSASLEISSLSNGSRKVAPHIVSLEKAL